MRILVAGGSGLIGRALTGSLMRDGHEVVVLSRNPKRASARLPDGVSVVGWDGGRDPSTIVDLAGIDVVVNLCGVPVGPRPWTPGRKHEIVGSRVLPAEALVRSIAALPADRRPAAYVSASGTDWYTDRDATPATEANQPPPRDGPDGPNAGEPFLRFVCRRWEEAALRAEPLGVRVALLRTSFVLAPGSSLMALIALPFRLWLGGPLGNGLQWFSWIHLDDVVGLYRLAIVDSRTDGPVNLAAPEPCLQRDFAKALGRALRRPSWLPAPAFAIRLVLGPQATLALGSRRVVPARALELGYRFAHTDVDEATAAAFRT
jgi:uncharacterized protein (TIGR01777 family)